MYSFKDGKLRDFKISNGLAVLLAAAERNHGEEIVLRSAEQALLATLKRTSIITSSEASCAIEGVYLAPERREEVLGAMAAPRNRDEAEVQNYKRALEFLYNSDPGSLEISPDLVEKLHAFVQDGAADAGEYWKTRKGGTPGDLPEGDLCRSRFSGNLRRSTALEGW